MKLKRDQHPGVTPVVELALTHWTSPKYGRIAAPMFKVVDWHGIPNRSASPMIDDEIPF